MPGMLDQLKGARVELQLGTETVTGTIVSARTFAGTDKQPEHEQLNLMLDTGEFRTVDLGAASGLRFPDPKLQQQFKDYLAALAAVALEGQAQRLHRFHRRQASATSPPAT